ncbi:hypothetical protein [Desulfoplanes formicivorans]|uniref:DUF1858 domain-containing protein n=1 Tax=Desulfoplanes formicivorans TaxID=1592317 RepID=A0A194AES5_9BACT|nr:hypothetical protein [Desulfoplanes formicivorans]GAU07833.1 hypothetical protein DPF_0532 [Desulfoplanes formicivorans]
MRPEDISPASRVLDIVAAYKTTEPVFRSYDKQAGECVLCNALFESLEGLAAKYHLDVNQLLARIRQAATTTQEQQS